MTMTAVDKTMGNESTTGASVDTERIRVIGAQAPASDSHCFCSTLVIRYGEFGTEADGKTRKWWMAAK